MKAKKQNQKVEVVPAPDARENAVSVGIIPAPPTRKNLVSVEIIPAPPVRKNVVSVGIIPPPEFAAAANLERANTDAERKVVKLFGELEIAELNFEPGKEFGRAVIELRDEIKKNGKRNFMTRLEELDIPYAKARYWIAVVEERPINRGKAKKDTAQRKAPHAMRSESPSADWHEDWGAATARFREVSSAIIMLQESQPAGREEFIGELEILVDNLGYELRPKKKETNGLLQRVQPSGRILAERTHLGGANRTGGSR